MIIYYIYNLHECIKYCIFYKSSLEKFQTAYKEFKDANNTKVIQEINKEYRKEFGISDRRMAIPGNLDNLIDQ